MALKILVKHVFVSKKKLHYFQNISFLTLKGPLNRRQSFFNCVTAF
jgi:hypothetical protein